VGAVLGSAGVMALLLRPEGRSREA
jgi:hypothetical protein